MKNSEMAYEIYYTGEAEANLRQLKNQGRFDKLKKIKSTVKKLKIDPKHPGLHTHKNNSIKNFKSQDTFQSYVENKTPGAFRIFWYWGPEKNEITIFAITPHP
jgi:hypothetical protein